MAALRSLAPGEIVNADLQPTLLLMKLLLLLAATPITTRLPEMVTAEPKLSCAAGLGLFSVQTGTIGNIPLRS